MWTSLKYRCCEYVAALELKQRDYVRTVTVYLLIILKHDKMIYTRYRHR